MYLFVIKLPVIGFNAQIPSILLVMNMHSYSDFFICCFSL